MTRLIYDEFSKDYLDKLLSSYGEINTGKTVASERREIDVYFKPYSAQLPEYLGLLGKLASQLCLFEPYRNPVNSQQVRACLAKLFAIEAEMIRESKRQKKYVQEDELPYLWILTPTASQTILSGFKTEIASNWGGLFCSKQIKRL